MKNIKGIKEFDSKIKRLEDIVNKLETDDKSLDNTVSLFQEGMKLSKECRTILLNVENSITEVVEPTDNSEIKTEKYNLE